MLRSPKSMGFVESFVTQWLGTRELGHEFVPDAKLFPDYAEDVELQADIRFQPVVFFHAMLSQQRIRYWTCSIRTGPSSRKSCRALRPRRSSCARTIRSSRSASSYLPGSHRGGLLGMSAVLAVSSYPHRTSPVLRGKWVLDSMLGTPPLPPPPNVPALEEHATGAAEDHARTAGAASREPGLRGLPQPHRSAGFRARELRCAGPMAHRGRGQADRQQAELPDGTKFEGPDELKRRAAGEKGSVPPQSDAAACWVTRWAAGLTRKDSCTVDSIVAQLAEHGLQVASR